MRTVVCVKQTAAGELNPFDACAYETALRMENNEVILLSMAPEKSREMLLQLTRLGAREAYLVSDKYYAGSDTLATSYILSLAIKKLKPDLIICGRQTVDGDTGQIGPELSEFLGYSLITNVMQVISQNELSVTCINRDNEEKCALFPALLTVERINDLRFPGIRSKMGTVTEWDNSVLNADLSRVGLSGSPTQVVKTFENNGGKRKCQFIDISELEQTILESLNKENVSETEDISQAKLHNICTVGDNLEEKARSVAETVTNIALTDANTVYKQILDLKPDAVLWGSDRKSKEISAICAARLNTGLCADCTSLETDGSRLFMYRPAFSGSIIAKIKCNTLPQMATVRTEEKGAPKLMCCVGVGARNFAKEITEFSAKFGGETVASRGAVDKDIMPYSAQVGLTGRCVSPKVYVAFGVSGAVHHIVGMKNSGTVIAINNDKNAPVFEYADYGIIANTEDIFKRLV